MSDPHPRPRLSVVALDCPDPAALVRFHLDPVGHPFCLVLAT